MSWLAVAIGGALGAMSRYGLTKCFPSAIGEFPWATLLANLAGSMLIGLCYVLIMEKGIVAEHWRPLLMVGFLGALTTFSTFSLDTLLLIQNGHWYYAMLYLLSTVIGCLLCAGVSIWLLQRLL